MSDQTSSEYFRKRAADARMRSQAAKDPRAAAIHEDMANRYEQMADRFKQSGSEEAPRSQGHKLREGLGRILGRNSNDRSER